MAFVPVVYTNPHKLPQKPAKPVSPPAVQTQPPAFDEIAAAIALDIADKHIRLPSFGLSIPKLYQTVHINQQHGVNHGFIESMESWAMIVKTEEHMLQHTVSGIVHGMDAKGQVLDEAFDKGNMTPRSKIDADKARLVQLYPTVHMAKGEATSLEHFRAIEEAAQDFVKSRYPQCATQAMQEK